MSTANSKSLLESIKEVKDARATRDEKHSALVKLGLRPKEAFELMSTWTVRASNRLASFTAAFGVELEVINCPYSALIEAGSRYGIECYDAGYTHANSPKFKLVRDGSLRGENPLECVTPILKGRKGMNDLKACCMALNEVGATNNRTTGLHVHVDARSISEKAYCNVFVNYMHLESVIDSFMANSRRGNNAYYAQSLKGKDIESTNTRDGVKLLLNSRYFKVNPESFYRHGTIEFRQHQGSTNYEKISQWVNFLIKLVGWSRTNRLENDITSIDEIPFLNDSEKRFFKGRKAELDTRYQGA